jgi:hypothetical protein
MEYAVEMVIFIFSLVLNVQAKFSSDIQYVPCQHLTVETKKCVDRSFSNEDYLQNKNLLQDETNLIRISGAVSDVEITSSEPGKCYKEQKIKVELFVKKQLSQAKIFVLSKRCSELPKKYRVMVKNNFCDTPGALMIEDCFFEFLTHNNRVLISEFIEGKEL